MNNNSGVIYRLYVIKPIHQYHCYIGKTRNLKQRFTEHKKPSTIEKCETNSFLLFNIYNKEDILIEEIEYFDNICDNCLLEQEQYFIEMYDCLNNYSIDKVLNNKGQKNLTRIREYEKTDKCKQIRKEYRKTDKWKQYKKDYEKTDKYKTYKKEYREKNKEKNKEYQKKYREEKKLDKFCENII
jgi:hypothetical protein